MQELICEVVVVLSYFSKLYTGFKAYNSFNMLYSMSSTCMQK